MLFLIPAKASHTTSQLIQGPLLRYINRAPFVLSPSLIFLFTSTLLSISSILSQNLSQDFTIITRTITTLHQQPPFALSPSLIFFFTSISVSISRIFCCCTRSSVSASTCMMSWVRIRLETRCGIVRSPIWK